MSVPDWTRKATQPTADEKERLAQPVDPALLEWARSSTAPSDAERARIRPRAQPALGAPWILVWGMAATIAFAAVGGWLARPETTTITAAPIEAGVYVITPGIDVVPVEGVVVSGRGTVRLVPGALRTEGALALDISSPVTVEHGGARFTTRSARIEVGPDGVAVVEGEVHAPDGALRAGERWPRVVAVQVPKRIVAPAPVPDAPVRIVPPPIQEVAVEVPPAPDATSEWRAVLEALEAGGPLGARIARLDGYLATWPSSPFRVEAEGLRLLLLGPAATFADVEDWLAANPGAPRALELHALAARIAREQLHDCVRAEAHDRVVADAGGAAGNRATAFLGLCALSLGALDEGRAFLDQVDADALDPALRQAVLGAR